MARQICTHCHEVTTQCNECMKTLKPGEGVHCDMDKWKHVCMECQPDKEPNATIEILD